MLSQQSLERFGDLPVLRMPKISYTYRELALLTENFSARLQERGCVAGGAVVARLGSGINFLALFLAATQTRCVFVPFAPSFPSAQLSAVARQFNASVIVEENGESLEFVAAPRRVGGTPDTELFKQGGFVRYTSGTTGSAKGVFVSFESAAARIASAGSGLNLPHAVRLFWPLEMAQHFVAVLPVVLMQGGSFVLADGVDQASYREAIEVCEANVMYAAPHHYQGLAEQPCVGHHLVRALSTTAPLAGAVAQRFYDRWRTRVDQVYGIFELGIVSAQDDSHREGVGCVMPNVNISLRDEFGREVTPGESGRVFVLTPGALDGYLDPIRTRQDVLSAGWFETGDIGTMSSQGDLILLGRSAAVIDVAGHKVFPEQVENVLNGIPGVSAARVFSQPDASRGNVVVADIVLTNGTRIDPAEIRRICGLALDAHSVPEQIFEVSEIATTPAGKIKRTAAMTSYSSGRVVRSGPIARGPN